MLPDFIGNTNAAPSSDKDILLYGVGTGFVKITGTSIGGAVPPSTNLTGLVAGFLTTGVRVAVGGVTQVSGTTPNNFTNPVIYTVTAADGSTKNYTVTVSRLVTSFSFAFTTFALKSLRAGTGPKTFSLRSSLDDFAADLHVFDAISPPPDGYVFVLGPSFANLTTPVEFRLYAFASASAGYWRIDDVQLVGSIVP